MNWLKENGLAIATGVAIGYAVSVILKPKVKQNGMITEDELNNNPIRFKYKPISVKKQNAISSDDPILEKDAVKKAIFGAPVPGSAIVEFDYLERFMKDTFLHYGMTEMDASISSDVLIASDKRGIDSHGIGRLKPIYCERMDAGILKPVSRIKIVKQTSNIAVVDGGGGLGLCIGPKCMQLAIDKAKANGGIGMVVVRNSTHYGFAGYYPLMADYDGCIGISGTNARPSIAPTYGVEPMMGTNPIVFGMPSADPFPFVIDCATSVNQRGKIEKYAREGKPTPAGCVLSKDGDEMTDSKAILQAFIERTACFTPLGGAGHKMAGYKGYGYAAVVEIMCAALQGNKWGADLADSYVDENGKKQRQPSLLGHFFIAIDISKFTTLNEFKNTTGQICNGFRLSRKDPKGPGRIYTAGEPEHLAWTHRSHYGGTNVPPPLQKHMQDLRDNFPDNLRIKYEKLPFEE
jgi:LDH2 family malate/lactate/ureidoglycolate dehydrogenase